MAPLYHDTIKQVYSSTSWKKTTWKIKTKDVLFYLKKKGNSVMRKVDCMRIRHNRKGMIV